MGSDGIKFPLYTESQRLAVDIVSHWKRNSCSELLPTVTYLFSHMVLNEQSIRNLRNWFHMPLFLSSLN